MELIFCKTEQRPNLDVSATQLSAEPQPESINFPKGEEQINIKDFQHKSKELGHFTSQSSYLDNIDLRVVTLQDCLKTLYEFIQFLITSMEKSEFNIAVQKRIQRRDVYCYREESNELLKCSKELNSLMKVVQDVYYDNNWDIKDLSLFETMPEIFDDIKKDSHNEAESNQIAHILKVELVMKQEEVESLKKQISLMEDQKQNMQEEIEFMDEIIENLNSAARVDVSKSNVRSLLSDAIEFFSSKF